MSNVVKRVENPELWEVWNEFKAESVYTRFEPSKEDLQEICNVEGWEEELRYIHVFRDTHLYTKNEYLESYI